MDIKITEGQDFDKLLALLSLNKKDSKAIECYRKEFEEIDRKQRHRQIGKIQVDKIITNDSGQNEYVKMVYVPIPFAKKIVNTSVAFEFGMPVKLSPIEENALSKQVLLDWKNCRLDHKIQRAKIKQKQETQAAILFYFKDVDSDPINKDLGVNKNRQLKCRLLDYDTGEYFPSFDNDGDMTHFVNFTKEKVFNEEELTYKEVDKCWVYDSENIIILERDGGRWVLEDTEKHGFSKIPVVYMSQEKPEHYQVQDAIDRFEVSISKLGDANDYSGHPILFLEGEVSGMPSKNKSGKALQTKVKIEDGKKVAAGDARFITYDHAPDSVKLELEKLEDIIYSMTSTPNISFSNLKSIGNLSGKALELMFLDSTLKKMMNEGQNRTDVERIIAIIISGIVTTTQQSFSSMVQNTFFNVEFGNVLPNNFDELVESINIAKQANVISTETAVEMLSIVDNIQDEIKKINQEKQEAAQSVQQPEAVLN